MGLVDKIKAYLNEEEALETEERKPKSAKKSLKIFGKKKKAVGEDYKAQFFDDEELVLVRANNSYENEKKVVTDFCEQLIDVSKHMVELDNEYRIVTDYLTDIQKIEELPIEYATKVNNVAADICKVDSGKKKYAQSEHLLSEEQFNIIESYEDEVVTTINRLEDMEVRDSLLKSDMSHLEGEKEILAFSRQEYNKGVSVVRTIIATTLALFFVVVAILSYVALGLKKSVTVYALVSGCIAMVMFAMAYLKYVDFRKDIKDTDAKYKRAVSLLNKVKVKYINNTNAIDYIYNKYNINSSKELAYVWEQYNTMVRDSRRVLKANNDLRVLGDKLVLMLDSIGISDSEIWIKQANALVNRNVLAAIKDGLIDRRQKLKERIVICHKINDNAKTALRAAVAETPGMEMYISELLSPYGISIAM